MNSTFSVMGNISSVLGFLFTLLVLMKVRGIHRSFLAQARLPDLRKKIRGHCSTLSKLLNDFKSAGPDIEAEIQKCHANLRNLQSKLSRPQAKNVKTLVTLTAQLIRSSAPPDKKQVRELYLALVYLDQDLDNLTEDMKWRTRE